MGTIEPGIHRDVPFADYARWPFINPSAAKHGRRSMLHFRCAADTVPPKPPTDAMVLGTATHCAIMEPDDFPRRFVLWEGARRAGAAWDAFVDANVGRIPLRIDDYKLCIRMRDAVHAHPAAAAILAESPEIETSLVWDDPSSGVRCKCRPDMIGSRIADVKQCRSVEERHILGNVSAFGYHVSMAAYTDGYYRLTNRSLDAVLIFVESTPPHDVVVRPFTSEAMQRGVEIWHELLGRIAECKRSGKWPGTSADEMPLDLPAWEMGANSVIDATGIEMEV